MSVFGNVWLYSAVAFVIGVLLTWAFWVRPLQKRLGRAKREALVASAAPAGDAAAPTLFEPDAGAAHESVRHEPEPVTSLLQPFGAGEAVRGYPADRSFDDYDADHADPFDDDDADPDGYRGRDYDEFGDVEQDRGDASGSRAEETPAAPEATEFDPAETFDRAAEPDGDPEGEEAGLREERDAAYLAYLERERDQGQGNPERHAGDLFTPSGGSGAPEEPVDAAELSLNGNYGSDPNDIPVVPEIPEVSGDDLTPFDPFSPDAEQTSYFAPADGTSELDYVTADTGEAGDIEDERPIEDAGGAADSTVTGMLPVVPPEAPPGSDRREQANEPVAEPATELFTPAASQEADPARSLFEPVRAADSNGDADERYAAGAGAGAGAELSMPEDPAGHADRSTSETPVGPFGPGSALPRADGGAPAPEFEVKARTSSMVFHTPNSPFYDRLLPQVWFRAEDDAKRAGFTSWERPQES
ncbi:MAG: hypothetical protein ACRDQA_03790 [Nocardioidaceae bacterium]